MQDTLARLKFWTAFLLLMCGLVAANVKCWQLGLGGRTDRIDGDRPNGAELELYFGWPACHRAELWRSDNSDLLKRFLNFAPFISPNDQMWLVARYRRILALFANMIFAVAVLGILIVYRTSETKTWSVTAYIAIGGLLLVALAIYVSADHISAHL